MNLPVFAKATALCGILDISYAAFDAVLNGRSVGDMLRGVASGLFGEAALGWGLGGAALGLVTHFAIMAVIVAVGLAILAREPFRDISAWKTGTLYGLIAYCVMYGAVLQLRFGAPFPNPDKLRLAIGLFPHIAFVGIPIALFAGGHFFRKKPATS